jgi:hypothetical protein
MQLVIINNTGSPRTYLSGAITAPANGSVAITNTVQQLSLSADATLRNDIVSALVNLSDSINILSNTESLDYLIKIPTFLVPLADTTGQGLTSTTSGSKQYLDTDVIQSEKISTNNSSTANLAASATFTGTSENVLGYAAFEITFKADQAVTIQAQQSTDNTNWDIVDSYTVAASTGDSRVFQANAQYVRVLVTNNGGSTTTFLRLQTVLTPIQEVLPRSLGQKNMANSLPVVLPSDQVITVAPVGGTKQTYSAAITNFSPGQNATDIFAIIGSATKTIKVTSINVSAIQTTAGDIDVRLIKRSSANTGGGALNITEVQNKYSSSTANATTSTCTVTSTGAGNLLVVGLGSNAARTIVSVSDGTNSFTQATGTQAVNTNNNDNIDIWYLLSSSSGKTTITVTWSGAAGTFQKEIWFWEVSGLTSPTFLTGSHISSAVGTGNVNTGTSFTTTAPQGFSVGVYLTNSGNVTSNPAPGNPYGAGGVVLSDAACSLIWSGAGTYTPAWTDAGTSNFCASTVAFISGAAAPGPGALTSVPHDSTNSAATAVINYYSANPTLGTLVGPVRSSKVFVSPNPIQTGSKQWEYGIRPSQTMVLRGVNEMLALNLNGGTVSGGSFDIDIEWTEE